MQQSEKATAPQMAPERASFLLSALVKQTVSDVEICLGSDGPE